MAVYTRNRVVLTHERCSVEVREADLSILWRLRPRNPILEKIYSSAAPAVSLSLDELKSLGELLAGIELNSVDSLFVIQRSVFTGVEPVARPFQEVLDELIAFCRG